MASKRKKTSQLVAAVEICPSRLHLVVAELAASGAVSLHAESVRWRQEATNLQSDVARGELTAALKQLAAKHKLHNLPLSMTLNGHFCVTRVVTGTAQSVRRRLDQIEQRTSLYLSLGQGRKAVSRSLRPIDARHQHALLMVVNQKTLDVIVDAVHRAGMEPARIEPALVSVCRLAGYMKADQEGPAVVIHVGERGVEMGVSYRGQSLLDYRPVGVESPEQVAKLVDLDLKRLQRYCQRYIRFTPGPFQRVFLCGDSQTLPGVAAAFQQRGALPVLSLDPAAIDSRWKFSGQPPGSELGAALGASLPVIDGSMEWAGPNLVEDWKAQSRGPLGRALVRTCWPIAAAIVLAMGLWGMRFYEFGRYREVERQLARYETAQQHFRSLQSQIVRHQAKAAHLSQMRAAVQHPAWHHLAAQIASCMPEDVWLETLQIDAHGHVALSGVSYTEDGVFEFVRWLRQSPAWARVALNGTGSSQLPSGPTTSFDVLCEFAGGVDFSGEESGDG